MKILVNSQWLKPHHIQKIKDAAMSIGADVYLEEDENIAVSEHPDAEVAYGFGQIAARKCTELKWLCASSAGVDHLIKPGIFTNENCLLTNSSGSYGVTMAEHMIAVTLMMFRKLTVTYEETLRCEWGPRKMQKSLKNCRVTVLGTGDIGSCFAKRVKAFEPAALVGVCRSGKSDEPSFDTVIKVSELEQILPRTDLLVLCLPETRETIGILSRRRLEMLSNGAYIVNVGRGSAIDEDALSELLEDERLAGAALDVFRKEPLPKDSPLWKTKNLLITPHVAGNLTVDYTLDRNVEMFCEDLINYAEGRPLKYLVDRKREY